MLSPLFLSLAVATQVIGGSYGSAPPNVTIRQSSLPNVSTLERGKSTEAVAVTIGERGATCRNVAIHAITVVDALTGDPRGLTVRARLNGRMVGTLSTLDREDFTANIAFSPPLVLSTCKVHRLSISLEASKKAKLRSRHNILLELPTDLLSDAEWKGAFPFRGPVITVR